jgi:restriction system protein
VKEIQDGESFWGVRQRIQATIEEYEKEHLRCKKIKMDLLLGSPSSYERVVFDMLERNHQFAFQLVQANVNLARIEGIMRGAALVRTAWTHRSNSGGTRLQMEDTIARLEQQITAYENENDRLRGEIIRLQKWEDNQLQELKFREDERIKAEEEKRIQAENLARELRIKEEERIRAEEENRLEQIRLQKDNELRKKIFKEETIKEFLAYIPPYLDILYRKRTQLIIIDDYENVDDEKWKKELHYFIEKTIFPKLEQNKFLVIRDSYRTLFQEIDEIVESHNSSEMNMEKLKPHEFEMLCAKILTENGWSAKLTKQTGDQGIDIIASYENIRAVFQCKLYSGAVGSKAVQEIQTGKSLEKAQVACVVTNSIFTKQAISMARQLDVYLLHFSELEILADRLRKNLKTDNSQLGS